ncbi:hypothetical protein PanNE5_03930 [Pandoraea sp. NE5]|nr:hypothetical protein PanNE5_03930 [Pandoraea sp. NE5]
MTVATAHTRAGMGIPSVCVSDMWAAEDGTGAHRDATAGGAHNESVILPEIPGPRGALAQSLMFTRVSFVPLCFVEWNQGSAD